MRFVFAAGFVLWFFTSTVFAHFGAVLPSSDIISSGDSQHIQLEVKFIQPMDLTYLQMERPKEFGVQVRGQRIDLLGSLREAKRECIDPKQKFSYWIGDFSIKRPGDHIFYAVTQPYWEPAEDLFIIHYTKVTVAALGLEDSWDQPLGLEMEIVPLSRPYGLWRGNLFSGRVLLKGQPVAFARVEIEYLNEASSIGAFVKPPADPFVTQVVKTDRNGVFYYAMPRAGWWGFAALNDADWTINHAGQEKHVEIGAVFWVHTRDIH